ncbi:MAG TPA: hypothetical protein VFK05_04525 [Polyangiaceae bacterium]|nr:hypothetical protein [Polyangiaceae bacterium]
MATLLNRSIHSPRVDLAARVEGRLPQKDSREVVAGLGGVSVMLAAFLTPFLRQSRNHWGVEAAHYLVAHAPVDEAARAAGKPWAIEPIGFAVDRRMLLGIKARAEW